MPIGYLHYHMSIIFLKLEFAAQRESLQFKLVKKAGKSSTSQSPGLEPKHKLGHLVRTADFKKVFSRGDITKWSSKIYTITEALHHTTPSYGINYLHE